MSVQVLASARTALEATRGTTMGTATRILYFESASHSQDVATIEPIDSRGGYQRLYRAYPGVERNTFEISGPVNFDDFTLLGQVAIGSASAGTVTAGTAYSWTFSANGTADTQRGMTVEYAYTDLLATVGHRVGGLVCDELTVTWEKGKPIEWSGKFLTAGTATKITAFTGSLSDRSEVTATGINWTAYMDSTTIGSTADTRITKAVLNVKNGFSIRDGANGSAAGIEVVKAARREVTLTLTRYFNDTTELDAYTAKTTRLARLKTVGAAIAGGTALYTHQVDVAGVPADWKTSAVDGLIYAEIPLHGIYHAQVGGGNDLSMYLINSLATIS